MDRRLAAVACAVALLIGCGRRPGECNGGSQLASPWPGVNGCADGQSRSLARGPRAPDVAWTYDTGVVLITSVVVAANGTIYIGTSSNLVALAPDGTVRWSVPGEGDRLAIDVDGNVIAATPIAVTAVRPD
ncbi:MAG: Pyrrolo-quinoline quinone repeat-containing protein [bacterium]|nr:Pyrrolo-quinoline quinone repeat-containing protein [bacterium]